MRIRWAWFSIAFVLGGYSLNGQGVPAVKSFEVAAIKPEPPFSFEKMMAGQIHTGSIRGFQADFQFVSLLDLLSFSYRVKPYQISGPAWIGDGRWDVHAKLPEGSSPDDVPEMMRSLLAERFKLLAHRENREHSAYQLGADNDGPKFKESPPDEEPASDKNSNQTSAPPTFSLGGFPGGGGNMNFNNQGQGVITGGPNGVTRVSQSLNGGAMQIEMSRMSMASLANMLSSFTDRPAIDGTGLKGNYQVALDLPFESMFSVIQSLGGAGVMQGSFPGFLEAHPAAFRALHRPVPLPIHPVR
jgi:uncharacterized protein (TIGR03435 family)